MAVIAPGQALGRYELLVPIGKGGMAQVWAARLLGSHGFQKIFAVKSILSEALDNTRMERMFLEEATLASEIHHPNVVGTLDLGEHEGTLYLVMEWVHGESLASILNQADARGGLPIRVAVNIIGQVCKGLHAAHELRDEAGLLLGVVHRDISTQNVMVTYSGTAKLADFGIAKVGARSSALTMEGEVKGKFAYMSPEQVSGQPVDRRSDIFALGVLLYLATTGHHPFRGQNPAATVRNVCSKQPAPPPSEKVPDYPPALEAVVRKALSKSADDRFATALELLEALEAALPEALETRFETQLAEYFKELYPTRPAERLAELRRAQQALDQARGEAFGPASSVSSLRAFSVDPSHVSSISGRASQVGAPPASLGAPPAEPPPLRRARAMWTTRAWGVAGAVTLLFLARIGYQAAQRPAAANTGPLAQTELAGPAKVSSPPVVPTPVTVPALPALPPTSTSSAPASSARSKSFKAPRPVRATGMSPVPVAVSQPPVAAPTPLGSANSDAATARRVNPWDDKNYGGRR